MGYEDFEAWNRRLDAIREDSEQYRKLFDAMHSRVLRWLKEPGIDEMPWAADAPLLDRLRGSLKMWSMPERSGEGFQFLDTSERVGLRLWDPGSLRWECVPPHVEINGKAMCDIDGEDEPERWLENPDDPDGPLDCWMPGASEDDVRTLYEWVLLDRMNIHARPGDPAGVIQDPHQRLVLYRNAIYDMQWEAASQQDIEYSLFYMGSLWATPADSDPDNYEAVNLGFIGVREPTESACNTLVEEYREADIHHRLFPETPKIVMSVGFHAERD
jgi:hypothetical protein